MHIWFLVLMSLGHKVAMSFNLASHHNSFYTFDHLHCKEERSRKNSIWQKRSDSSQSAPTSPTIYSTTRLAASSDNDKSDKKRGYRFGDLTKSVVNRVTKKPKGEEYQFGDITRYLDKQAKNRVAKLSNKEEYEFGDLSRYIDSKVKDEVKEFTNKKNYKFGDLSKEIIKRAATYDFQWKDMITLCKALLSFGIGLSPIGNFLPTKFLLDLLKWSLIEDVGGRLVSSVTLELDKRMKKAVTGDEQYQLGDLAKKELYKFIGKEEYKFGDITRTVLESVEEDQKQPDGADKTKDTISKLSSLSLLTDMEEDAAKQLEDWDKKFLEEQKQDIAKSMKPEK